MIIYNATTTSFLCYIGGNNHDEHLWNILLSLQINKLHVIPFLYFDYTSLVLFVISFPKD